MQEAEEAKPPVTRLLERYAGQYMSLVLLVAGGTWFASGDMAATLAVLVASCPCALVLAAPATSIAAIAVAARHGILIKGAAFLESLAEVERGGVRQDRHADHRRTVAGARRAGGRAERAGVAGGRRRARRGEQPSGEPGGGARRTVPEGLPRSWTCMRKAGSA